MYFSGRLWLGEKGRGRKPKQQKKGSGGGRKRHSATPSLYSDEAGGCTLSGPRVRLSQQTPQQHLWEAAFLPHIVVVKRHRSLSSIIQRVWDLCRRDQTALPYRSPAASDGVSEPGGSCPLPVSKSVQWCGYSSGVAQASPPSGPGQN